MMKHLGRILVVYVLLSTLGPGTHAGDSDKAPITFSREVVRIFQEKCQTCHRPGDIAPMSLMTYDDSRPWAKSIRKAVSEGTMPPWHADPAIGKFRNDISLSKEEIETIVHWVDEGAPQGNQADLPEPKVFAHNGWKAGAPDLVLMMPESYTVPGDLADEYRCFVVDPKLEHDVWVKAVEHRPGNPIVVHHVIDFLDSSETSVQMDQADQKPGFECGMGSVGFNFNEGLGGWAPGNEPYFEPDGVAMPLKKGQKLILQMHYHNTSGKAQADQTSIGLFLTDKPVRQVPKTMPVSSWRLNIPAGDANAEHRAQWKAPSDLTIESIMPHMHFIGKDMTVVLSRPDGSESTILSVPRYDFNWQRNYEFIEPVKVPKGSTIKMLSHHDNSAANPANPNKPPKDIKFGEATDDEMAIAWVNYLVDEENVGATPTAHPKNWSPKE